MAVTSKKGLSFAFAIKSDEIPLAFCLGKACLGVHGKNILLRPVAKRKVSLLNGKSRISWSKNHVYYLYRMDLYIRVVVLYVSNGS